ncbi:glycosyltransferase family 4 protein [Candidatus Shapirobacteria bacterium]|nr:glycosyltransferase family 4 protein [Candidatus Shapirobacteria bacterium]
MPTSVACSLANMKIGIDVNALVRPQYTGVERYVFELLSEMMKTPLLTGERVFLYASQPVKELGVLPAGWEWRILTLPILQKGWTHIRLSWELMINPPDVFFCPAHEVPLGAIRSKIVTTIHDIAFVHVPEVYSQANRLRQAWAVRRAIRSADKILSVSQTTADDLSEHYHVSQDKMIVTRLGIRPEKFEVTEDQIYEVRRVYQLSDAPYLLTVGRVEKKKGIEFLIDVFEAYADKHAESDLRLVLAGKFGHGQEVIENRINKSPVKDRILVLGFVPESHLAPLMNGAHAYMFPSTYEGFGIPALEAMASGTPVIASDVPALKEVCGEAGVIRSHGDVDAWVKALEMFNIAEARDGFVQNGLDLVKQFNWRDTAQKTWEVLRSVK